jgi:hypothetical protein
MGEIHLRLRCVRLLGTVPMEPPTSWLSSEKVHERSKKAGAHRIQCVCYALCPERVISLGCPEWARRWVRRRRQWKRSSMTARCSSDSSSAIGLLVRDSLRLSEGILMLILVCSALLQATDIAPLPARVTPPQSGATSASRSPTQQPVPHMTQEETDEERRLEVCVAFATS